MPPSFRHLPPELQAAYETLAAARRDALPTRRARLGRVLAYLILLAAGAAIGAGLVSSSMVTSKDNDFWRAALTVVSILSGFMVTTMVFTGKIDASKSLTLSELRDVTSKISYLLLYQIGTLANHLACLSVMLLLPALAAQFPMIGDSPTVIGLALLFVSIARSLLVPVQIIELHRFTHAALLREKSEEAKAKANL